MATVLMVTAQDEAQHTRKPSRFELTTALYGEDETILAKMSNNARYNNSTGKQIDNELAHLGARKRSTSKASEHMSMANQSIDRKGSPIMIRSGVQSQLQSSPTRANPPTTVFAKPKKSVPDEAGSKKNLAILSSKVEQKSIV